LKDLTLIEIIEDAGLSGKNLKRPGAQKILTLARKKQVDAIVVYKLDRIFRSVTDALETTKMFEKCGVSSHSIEETSDTQSAMGRFFFILMASLAELERYIIGAHTKAAIAHKWSMNEKTGSDISYGYDLTPEGLLIKNDAEQKVIKLIRHMHRQGALLRGAGNFNKLE
jgi:site-specific DNA recombinase